MAATLALAACGGGGGATGGGGTRGGGQGKNLNVTPKIVVQNEASVARTETIRASVGFTETMIRSLANVGVRGIGTAWLPLETWPDGSIKLALAQFTDSLAANENKSYEVVRDVEAASGSFEAHPWVAGRGTALRIGARVRDTFDVVYEAEIANATPETVQQTYLVRTQRYRLYHRAVSSPGIGRDFLTSTMYVTQFRDMPYVTVDWIVGNDYLGIDDTTGKVDPNYFPLGTVDLNRADFLVRGVEDAVCYFGTQHGVAPRASDGQGWSTFKAIENDYIDDGQTRRYRFQLRVENPGAGSSEKDAWRNGFDAFCEHPLFPLVDIKSWQDTEALGLYAGPVTGPADSYKRAVAEYQSWLGYVANHGTWGDYGDVRASGTTGTPRNTPISTDLAHAVQGNYPQLLQALEQKAWAQACRPSRLYGIEVGSDENVLLWDMPPVYPGSRDLSGESFGRRAIWLVSDPYWAYRTRVDWGGGRAHYWTHYDPEHMSTNLLYDYWAMSGDAWAHEELRTMGHCIKGLMRLRGGYTASMWAARSEGWCLQSMVQCWLASHDDTVKQHAIRRIHEVIDPQSTRTHASKALAMSETDARTGFPQGNYRFFAPWGAGSQLYGMLAVNRFMGDELALSIAEDVATTVDYSWVTNYQDPKWGLVKDGLRYWVPAYSEGQPVPPNYFDAAVGVKWGDSPLGGAHSFLIGGLFLLANMTESEAVANKALKYGRKLLGDLDSDPNARWYKWDLVVIERLAK